MLLSFFGRLMLLCFSLAFAMLFGRIVLLVLLLVFRATILFELLLVSWPTSKINNHNGRTTYPFSSIFRGLPLVNQFLMLIIVGSLLCLLFLAFCCNFRICSLNLVCKNSSPCIFCLLAKFCWPKVLSNGCFSDYWSTGDYR